jgi:hypothetical protein
MLNIDKESKNNIFFLKKTKNYRFTTTTLPAIIIKLYIKNSIISFFYGGRGFPFSICTSYVTCASPQIR